eukprot:6469462-Amphidinium_carterae.1
MLGKRQRYLLPANASPAKRLKANFDDLLASGLVSGARYCTLVNDAADAGLQDCYSASARATTPHLHLLLKEMLRDSRWPKPKAFRVPLLARDQADTTGELSFLLPHELLHVLVSLAPE